uniref:Transposase n=1 Tax=Candidatus Kentrum sp. LFY TaxID=2126342 RepID=A0A450UZB7_9GAMM|nr:MAG: hypothetical protein BECKLFY1418A_GA0070994_107411 [Candidatus Kentron sp. LFY]
MTAVLHSKGYTGNTVLYMAMESSNSKWKLGFSNGNRDRIVPIDAGNWKALLKQIDLAREKLQLPEACPVVSCFEAGRDGFWIHRMLEKGTAPGAKTPRRGRENESDEANHHPDAITGCWSAVELDLGDGIATHGIGPIPRQTANSPIGLRMPTKREQRARI